MARASASSRTNGGASLKLQRYFSSGPRSALVSMPQRLSTCSHDLGATGVDGVCRVEVVVFFDCHSVGGRLGFHLDHVLSVGIRHGDIAHVVPVFSRVEKGAKSHTVEIGKSIVGCDCTVALDWRKADVCGKPYRH